MGANGYMGGEAIRVLLNHPSANVSWASSRKPGLLEDFHPNLYGLGLKTIHADEAGPCDVVFLALPTEQSIHYAHKFLQQGIRVIDLGAAFRLKDRTTWEKVYHTTHAQWQLSTDAVYGINELHQKEIVEAKLIANPGCFSSAAILALAPAVKAGWVEVDKLIVNGLSGTAGAGASLSSAAHHPEIANNLVAYNVTDHRHSYEMEQELSQLAKKPVTVHFTPAYVPIVRGILNICHCFPLQAVTRLQLLDLYRDFYRDDPFVLIYDKPFETDADWQYKPYPPVSSVAGSNYCYIGLDVDEKRNRIVVFSTLDSIGKGGAQVAIENMNLMFGLPRSCGLQQRGQHPR